MDKMRALELFVLVSKCGSYADAAKQSGASPSSISKAVSRLEQILEFKLFKRSTRDLKLTDEGSAYLEVAQELLSSLSESENQLKSCNENLGGLIRINTPFDYGHMYLQPFLVEFNKKYPQVNIEVSFEDGFINFVSNNSDLVIRTGTLSDSNMTVRRLSPMDFVLCASPAYLQNVPIGFRPEDLKEHTWIRFRMKSAGKLVPVVVGNSDGSFSTMDVDTHFVVDNGLALAKLCVDGVGIAQMPHFLARKWLLSGELVPVHPPYSPPTHGVYLLYNDRNFLAKRCRVFIDEMVQFVEARNETPSRTWVHELVIHNS